MRKLRFNMSTADSSFGGSVPAIYQRYLVPLIFQPYAVDLAARVRLRGAARVLECSQLAIGVGLRLDSDHDPVCDARHGIPRIGLIRVGAADRAMSELRDSIR